MTAGRGPLSRLLFPFHVPSLARLSVCLSFSLAGLSILSCPEAYSPADGSSALSEPLAAAVPQGKDGHIHDVKWSPLGRSFAVAAGSMPAAVAIHSDRGERVYDLGAAHRNVIAWSPSGRFLCVAGFGNLVGDMDFYDIQANKKPKKIGSNNSHCAVTFGWSPDSRSAARCCLKLNVLLICVRLRRYFMTATLAPRMNVDNGFKIFRYDAVGPIYHERIAQCFEAFWIPSLPSVYPDRGRSPARTAAAGAGAHEESTPIITAAPVAASAPQASKQPAAAPTAAYR